MTKAYLPYSEVLKAKFGCRVYKLTLDAGFTCPNRDATKGVGGCTFCDETGSSSRAQNKKDTITVQLEKNMTIMRRRFKAEKFVAYFQSYTNTYSRPERLKRLYDEALYAHPDIVGLSISTRPDCVDPEKLDLIASYMAPDRYICVGIRHANHSRPDIGRLKTAAKPMRISCKPFPGPESGTSRCASTSFWDCRESPGRT